MHNCRAKMQPFLAINIAFSYQICIGTSHSLDLLQANFNLCQIAFSTFFKLTLKLFANLFAQKSKYFIKRRNQVLYRSEFWQEFLKSFNTVRFSDQQNQKQMVFFNYSCRNQGRKKSRRHQNSDLNSGSNSCRNGNKPVGPNVGR